MKRTSLLGASTLAIAVATTATAQDATVDSSENEPDVVVVTATKREQTLQEVPIAVSVIDEGVISDSQINDVIDLQSVVPSLRVSQLERANNTTFIIRGFGNGGNNPGIEPSVAVFIDGVFRSRSGGALADFLDLERIEVLRGPQSTLFGKNASAGVVSVVTKKPSYEHTGVAELVLGNYNQIIGRGYISGPISDKAAFSLSGNVNTRDGYTENLGGGEDINDRDRWGLRGQLLFEPSSNLELRVIGDYDEIDEVCCTVFNTFEGPIDANGTTTSQVIGLLGGRKQEPGNEDFDVFYDQTSVNKITNGGASVQADWLMSDNITVTSITSYRNSEEDIAFEGDFTTLEILGDNARRFETDTLTQEIRILGDSGPLSWLLGGYYFDEEATHDITVEYGADARAYADVLSGNGVTGVEQALGLPAGVFYAAGNGVRATATQDNRQYSLFAQGDFAVTDRLTLTLGASYYNDRKEVAITSDRNNTFSDLNFVTIGGQAIFAEAFFQTTGLPPTDENIALIATTMPEVLAAIQAAAAAGSVDPAVNSLLGLTFAGLQPLGPITDFPNSVETDPTTSDDHVPFTVRAAYDVTDNTNIYASYATGFKASSWNLTQDSRPVAGDIAALGAAGLLPDTTLTSLGLYAGTRFAGPEESSVIEIGLKTNFGRGSLAVAAFDQTIENFQSATFQGAGFVLSNAGEQSVTGFEFDSRFDVTDGLSITWAGTYLDAEYDSFPDAAVPISVENPSGVADLTGERPAGIPEFASSVGVDYRFDVAFGEAFVRGDYQYESEVQVIDNVPEEAASRQVNLLNASFGLNMNNGIEAMVWGRNLTDEVHFTSAFPTTLQPNSFSAYPNPPRTYGVTLRKRW